MSRVPVIDIKRCNQCESCIEICPDVFRKNSETDCIEVVDLPEYPEDAVLEAMSICPVDCISWDQMP